MSVKSRLIVLYIFVNLSFSLSLYLSGRECSLDIEEADIKIVPVQSMSSLQEVKEEEEERKWRA